MGRILVCTLAILLLISVGPVSCVKPAPATTSAPAPAPKPPPTPVSTPTPASKPAPKPTSASTPAKPAATTTAAAAPESAAEFFKKNRVTLVAPMAAGGGTDLSARFVAAFWTEATDGNMYVKNVPGGGTMVGMNNIASAKPDGLTIGLSGLGMSLVGPKLFQDAGMKFDPAKFQMLALFDEQPRVFGVATRLTYNSMAEIQKMKGIKIATASKMGGPSIAGVLTIHLFGLEGGKVITGYNSTPECSLACARGEVDGYTIGQGTYFSEMSKGYFKKPFVSVSFKRGDVFPDCPAVPELMKLTPEQEALLTTYELTQTTGRLIFAPPGVPEDRIKFLRQGFDNLFKLKAFQAYVKDRSGAWSKPTPAEEVQEMLKKGLSLSKGNVDALMQVIDKYVK